MKSLGISIREISIKDACIQHFKDIDHNIIGTGDLSELALGWATYIMAIICPCMEECECP